MTTNPRNTEPLTLTLTAREVSRDFSETISQVWYCGRQVNVTKRGKIVAVIVPPEPQPADEGTRGRR